MNMRTGVFDWNIDEVAAALKITREDTRAYFTDGRRVSFLLESEDSIRGA
jgi:hypothetical protein